MYEKRKKLIYQFICDDFYVPMKLKELAVMFQVQKEERQILKEILDELESEGKIHRTQTGKYVKGQAGKLVGIYQAHARGFGFVTVEGFDEDIFISDLLGYILHYYKIRIFDDVKNFYTTTIHHSPALVIINLSSGNHSKEVEICQKIRETGTSSFIPIILLTAEDNKDDILRYYEMGIDSFFEKPIDPSILLARVRSLLKSRKNLKEQMKWDMMSNPKLEVIESADDKFMNRVMKVIEQNISNEDFSLADFAQQMNMSRSVLHSRIQSLVNQSPIELLRSVRMKRAAQLLLAEAYNITQISYMIGFSDPRYFSTCFKKQYGTTPREYIRKHKNDKQETQ